MRPKKKKKRSILLHHIFASVKTHSKILKDLQYINFM